MPARWQSSQRPLFVRTVWVNGIRHAILSADDPLFQCRSPGIPRTSGGRPSSCSSIGTFTSSSSGSGHHCEDTTSCDLEHCLIKLQLVLTNNKNASKPGSSRTAYRHRSASSSRQNAEQCCDSGNDILQDLEENNSITQTSMVGHYRRPYLPYVFPSSSDEEQETVEDNGWMFSDVGSFLPDIQLNPLSERVLQWLDLARKSAGITEEERSIPIPCCEKRISKERPVPRCVSTPVHHPPSAVSNQGRHTSKRACQKMKSVDLDKMSTAVLETGSINSSTQEECLRVTARGMKSLRKKRQTLEHMRAVIDETIRCESPVKERVCDVPKTLDERNVPPQCDTPPPAPAPPENPPLKPSTSRPQLHIFMPTLERDCSTIQQHDATDTISECGSYWSEA